MCSTTWRDGFSFMIHYGFPICIWNATHLWADMQRWKLVFPYLCLFLKKNHKHFKLQIMLMTERSSFRSVSSTPTKAPVLFLRQVKQLLCPIRQMMIRFVPATMQNDHHQPAVYRKQTVLQGVKWCPRLLRPGWGAVSFWGTKTGAVLQLAGGDVCVLPWSAPRTMSWHLICSWRRAQLVLPLNILSPPLAFLSIFWEMIMLLGFPHVCQQLEGWSRESGCFLLPPSLLQKDVISHILAEMGRIGASRGLPAPNRLPDSTNRVICISQGRVHGTEFGHCLRPPSGLCQTLKF